MTSKPSVPTCDEPALTPQERQPETPRQSEGVKLSKRQRQVLAEMAEDHSPGELWCMSFTGWAQRTGLPRTYVARAIRIMAKKGLTQFRRMSWTEDGDPVGAGYGCTDLGAAVVAPSAPD